MSGRAEAPPFRHEALALRPPGRAPPRAPPAARGGPRGRRGRARRPRHAPGAGAPRLPGGVHGARARAVPELLPRRVDVRPLHVDAPPGPGPARRARVGRLARVGGRGLGRHLRAQRGRRLRLLPHARRQRAARARHPREPRRVGGVPPRPGRGHLRVLPRHGRDAPPLADARQQPQPQRPRRPRGVGERRGPGARRVGVRHAQRHRVPRRPGPRPPERPPRPRRARLLPRAAVQRLGRLRDGRGDGRGRAGHGRRQHPVAPLHERAAPPLPHAARGRLGPRPLRPRPGPRGAHAPHVLRRPPRARTSSSPPATAPSASSWRATSPRAPRCT